jgi:hypothetical protein
MLTSFATLVEFTDLSFQLGNSVVEDDFVQSRCVRIAGEKISLTEFHDGHGLAGIAFGVTAGNVLSVVEVVVTRLVDEPLVADDVEDFGHVRPFEG